MVNPVRAATAIAITEPGLAGTSSAINETFQQLGPAVGVAAIGAIFVSKVSSSFAALPVARHLSPALSAAIEKSLTSGTTGISGGKIIVPGSLKEISKTALSQASRLAYLDGMHFVMIICAILSILAAVVAGFLIRPQDMYSEVSMVPPDFAEDMSYRGHERKDIDLATVGVPVFGGK